MDHSARIRKHSCISRDTAEERYVLGVLSHMTHACFVAYKILQQPLDSQIKEYNRVFF